MINPINVQNVAQTQYPQAFRGGGVTPKIPSATTLQPSRAGVYQTQPDTVELSAKNKIAKNKKKGMSTGAKWALGIGGTLSAIAATAALVMKHDSRKLAKLCEEKIKLTQLAENIEFKEAKTVEEGIKFAKEVLKIKEVDENFTLEALNWANQGIVNVSNANKGKLFVPTKLRFLELGDSVAAYANHAIRTDGFGELAINSKHFNDEFLTKRLDKFFEEYTNFFKNKTKKTVDTGVNGAIEPYFEPSSRCAELKNKYLQDSTSLSVLEKNEIFRSFLEHGRNRFVYTRTAPIKVLDKWGNFIRENGIAFDYEAISKLSIKEQKKSIAEIIKKLENKNVVLELPIELTNPYHTIHHEMGHLQDYAANLEALSKKDTMWEQIKRIFKGKDEDVQFEGSRWLKISDVDGALRKELKENPKNFKGHLPDLYEHVTNPEIQAIAGEISAYAQKGVGEFVAEVYAEMINGAKLSDRVLNLYKKYNGPLPPAYM